MSQCLGRAQAIDIDRNLELQVQPLGEYRKYLELDDLEESALVSHQVESG